MAKFAISFRVGYEGDYSERYSSITSKIRDLAVGSVWEETTSFVLIECFLSTDQVAGSIYIGSSMRTDLDTLLVMKIGSNEHATRGKIKDPSTLASFFEPQLHSGLNALFTAR